MKKKAAILNIIFVILFGIYLITDQFIHFNNTVRIIALTVYFVYAIVRVICFFKHKEK